MAYKQDPGDTKDYSIDWSPLLLNGDVIESSSWVVATGLTALADPAPSDTDTTTTIWLSDGVAGTDVRVTNHIVTTQGREFERSFTVSVQEL